MSIIPQCGKFYGRNTGISLLEGQEGNTSSDGELFKTITLDQLIALQNYNEKVLSIIAPKDLEFEALNVFLETLRSSEVIY